MEFIKELYLKFLTKGNMMIDGKEEVLDYFNFILGMITAFAIMAITTTEYIITSVMVMAVVYCLFVFINDNFKATPDMIFEVTSDNDVEHIVDKLEEEFKKRDNK